MKRHVLTLFVLFSFLFACKKDKSNAPLKLEGTYKSESKVTLSNPIMLTVHGTTTNQSVIEKYIKEKGMERFFSFDKYENTTTPDNVEITFNEDSSVNIKQFYGQVISAQLTFQNTGGVLITHKNSVNLSSNDNGSKCSILSENIRKVKPEKELIPFHGGYLIKPVFLLEIKGQEIYIPIISYISNSYKEDEKWCVQTVGNTWNVFNPEVSQLLQTADTIVYQQKHVRLIKN